MGGGGTGEAEQEERQEWEGYKNRRREGGKGRVRRQMRGYVAGNKMRHIERTGKLKDIGHRFARIAKQSEANHGEKEGEW